MKLIAKQKPRQCSEAMSREFWKQHQAMSQTIAALNQAIKGKSMLNLEGGGQEQASPRRAVSTY